ncbi:hypothetical protein AMTR_s00004p00269520 [Amborella trichopoda]|uniref:Uncharacterized protein n=1 Tax=Amborella trichopoda TaxID=13333 RepID=W1NEF8_AMBTC|nr:hypothetical protein AMTR_s00004p00269520 [Amborella trichopoda]
MPTMKPLPYPASSSLNVTVLAAKPSPCLASSSLNVTVPAAKPSPCLASSSLSLSIKTMLFLLQPLQNHGKTIAKPGSLLQEHPLMLKIVAPSFVQYC